MVKPAAAQVFVPATVGNIGPGFDVLGLAVDGLGDRIAVSLVSGASQIVAVHGRDAHLVPRAPEKNCAVVAALSWLRAHGDDRGVEMSFDRSLPISGGLGSSAAASVGGALAAALATGKAMDPHSILAAALDGEASVAGRHLDNIAPAFFGGVCVVLSVAPPDVAPAVVAPTKNGWWLTLATPNAKLDTKDARAVLPGSIDRTAFIRQMANTAGLLTAFAAGDYELARRSLVDEFAEPRRAPLIPNFARVKSAALHAGALGSSISGAGPTVFALSDSEAAAKRVATAMIAAFAPVSADAHVGRLSTRGAHAL